MNDINVTHHDSCRINSSSVILCRVTTPGKLLVRYCFLIYTNYIVTPFCRVDL